ncbi:unnamed protein product [Prorocentrum cordatum]|uniref:Myosin motor domain-containing protein n=1 Tax=Prorocentrum cordatum TaxID=2364126 RepID=A0ABN9YER4_9DINO|nr:unnamed protein product [Polarella glacialis]
MLDEDLMMPQASDLTFSRKVLQGHAKHPRIVAPKFAGGALFGIRHYAGEVSYSCDGFLEKNADRLPSLDAVELLSASPLPVVCAIGRALGEQAAAQGAAGGPRPGQGQRKSATARFRTSLRALMHKIGRADTHYVRCVKPNTEKAVRIRQAGYSSRLSFRAFALRYRCVVAVRLPRSDWFPCVPRAAAGGGNERAAAHELVLHVRDRLELAEAQFVLGATKVFIKAEATTSLESARTLACMAALQHMQSAVRAATVRRRVAAARPLLLQLLRWLRGQTRPLMLLRYDALQTAESELAAVADLLARLDALPLRFGLERRAALAERRLREEILALALVQRHLRGALVRGRLRRARGLLADVHAWLARCCPEPAVPRRGGILLLQQFATFEAAEQELALIGPLLQRAWELPLPLGVVARAGPVEERLRRELCAVRTVQRVLRAALVRARLSRARGALEDIKQWESRCCGGRDWRSGRLDHALARQFGTFERAEDELSLVASRTAALPEWAGGLGLVRRVEATCERLWSEVQALRRIQRTLRGAATRRRVAAARGAVVGVREWLLRVCPAALECAATGGEHHPALLERLRTLENAELELASAAECLSRAAALPFDFGGLVERAGRAQARLQAEVEALQAARDQVHAASLDAGAMRVVLERASELALPTTLEDVAALVDRARKVEAQVPVAEALREVVSSGDFVAVPDALRGAEHAGLLRDPQLWLPELGGPALLAQVAAIVEAKEAHARVQAERAAAEAQEALERQRIAEAVAAGLPATGKKIMETFADAARRARAGLPPGFAPEAAAGPSEGGRGELDVGPSAPRARQALLAGAGRADEPGSMGRVVARLTEERDGLREAMQEALVDALGREEALLAECRALRRGDPAPGPRDLGLAAAAARSRLVAENVRLQADLVSARAAARGSAPGQREAAPPPGGLAGAELPVARAAASGAP